MMDGIRYKRSGFTLLEILIGLAIFMMVLIPVLEMFNFSYESYLVQDDIAAMQQESRVAAMLIQRDIRMAGSGMMQAQDGANRVYPIGFQNGGTDGPDELTINYADYEQVPPLTLDPSQGTITLSDVPSIQVSGMFSADDYDTEDRRIYQDRSWEELEDALNNGDIGGFDVIISDGFQSDILWITGFDTVNGQMSFNSPSTREYDANIGVLVTFYRVNQDAANAPSVRYFIEDDTLIREYENRDTFNVWGQELAQNVEDLQFAFNLDTDGDRVPDTWVNDRNLTNAERDQVRQVRVSMLARTAREYDELPPTGYPAIEDRPAGPTSGEEADQFRRRLTRVVVELRNPRPLP